MYKFGSCKICYINTFKQTFGLTSTSRKTQLLLKVGPQETMLAHHRQGAEGGWFKTMITGSFGGKTLIKTLFFRIRDFQPISCGCKFSCKIPHVMCLSSCKSNDNLRNIITEGIPYSATACCMVCASLRIYSSSCRTRKNVSDFGVIAGGYR